MTKNKEEETAELLVSYIDSLKENIKELEQENKELKNKLKEIEEAYIEFEHIETAYNKKLWELDELIMNR